MTSQRIANFVEEYKDLIRNAANEAEVRSRFETAAISKLDIRDLKLEQGRQDVRRNRVIIEFKDKGLFFGRKDSRKFNEAKDQLIKQYIPEQAKADQLEPSDYIGVCFDGVYLAFIYIEENGNARITDLQPFDINSAETLVLALDRDRRIELTPQNAVDDFGPFSTTAKLTIQALWTHLTISLENHVNRIIRNYFASAAVGKCYFIASNPPWVRWSELPASYAQRIKSECMSYKIFSEDKYFGGNELDISAMITYSVADKWLEDDGKLSFVIPQTHFQSPSSGGFRRFEVKGTPLKVRLVDDFVDVRPFMGLGNKPTVINLEKGQKTTYPVTYLQWKRTIPDTISENVSWDIAKSQLTYEINEANALSGVGSQWSILPPGRFEILGILNGEDPQIMGRKGILTDLNGAYFIELLGPGSRPNTVRFRNTPDQGRNFVPLKVGQAEIDVVYPLIKGAENIRAFYATTSPLFVIVPNKGITINSIPIVTEFARNHFETLQYIRQINSIPQGQTEGILDRRSTWKTRMLPLFKRRVQQGKLAAFDNLDYAHFGCAILNSKIVRSFIDSFTIKIQVGTLFGHIHLPLYDPRLSEHLELVSSSKEAHRIQNATNGKGSINDIQTQIDRLVISILERME